MSVRDFSTVDYIPIVSVRPSEMLAIEELPDRDKNLLLPLIPIGPWATAHRLASSLSRVENAFGRRPLIADICADEPENARRPVHGEIEELRDPADGYANWCAFIEENQNFIPVLQIADISNLQRQLERFGSFDREIVLRIPEVILGRAPSLAREIANHFEPQKVCVMLDFERQSRDLLTRQANALGIMSGIHSVLPDCFISTSASSFPESFVGLPAQDIYERLFFDGILNADIVDREKLIYSDRGSVRAGRQGGGSGAPSPRVDCPSRVEWQFFREVGDDRQAGYVNAAVRAMESPVWDDDLMIWGTQMVRRTAEGDMFAINSPQKSTAARINIHLHLQVHYDAPDEDLYDTDDDWTD